MYCIASIVEVNTVFLFCELGVKKLVLFHVVYGMLK